MTSIASTQAPPIDAPASMRRYAVRIGLALPLVALGEYLCGAQAGSALILFILGLALAAAIANPWRTRPRTRLVAGAGLFSFCLPLVEDFGLFPALFGFGGAAVFALLLTGEGRGGWLRKPIEAALLLLSGPKRLLLDTLGVLHEASQSGWGRSLFSVGRLVGWIVPIGLLGVFALLFADANPLIARWLVSLDPGVVLYRIEPGRILFWGFLLLVVWPFVHTRLAPASAWRTFLGWTPAAPAPAAPTIGDDAAVARVPLSSLLFGREAIARSLVLFNLLFGVQTLLDAVYLWGGAALPAGVTYASYAHRGAYPLIATALLAAGFVLAAMRRGGPAENAPVLRGLVYLFVAQNVGLVLSSILRLDLYVSVYSLTYWRVAAFIWMGLVAIGLVLIAVRIVLRQSNRWLIGANLIAATATLYVCCFVNFAGLIAAYNVDHFAKSGGALDIGYLADLGPDAIPAIDLAIPSTSLHAPFYGASSYQPGISRQAWLLAARKRLAHLHAREQADWRAWTYRGWRLSGYLAANPDAPTPKEVPSPRPKTEAPRRSRSPCPRPLNPHPPPGRYPACIESSSPMTTPISAR